MSFLDALVIAVAVSADAFAVALTRGLRMPRFRALEALAIALVFGVFQAVMPLLGWALGAGFLTLIEGFDHWIAFGLLAVVGGRMIIGAVRGGHGEEEPGDGSPIRLRPLLVLAVATSIDALAVGVSLAALPIAIVPTVLLIGAVTAVLAFVGVAVGRRVGTRFGAPAEILGGAVLILIGVRILLDHLGVL